MGGTWIVGAVSVVLFLVAAKAHGRELRLEREAHGIASVDFRAVTPDVQARWSAERVRFWSFFVPLALGLVVLALRLELGRVNGVVSALAWAGAASFAVTGMWAIGRRLALGAPAAWPGSLGWWMAVATLAVLVAAVATKARQG